MRGKMLIKRGERQGRETGCVKTKTGGGREGDRWVEWGVCVGGLRGGVDIPLLCQNTENCPSYLIVNSVSHFPPSSLYFTSLLLPAALYWARKDVEVTHSFFSLEI